jgi:hypothetical protein
VTTFEGCLLYIIGGWDAQLNAWQSSKPKHMQVTELALKHGWGKLAVVCTCRLESHGATQPELDSNNSSCTLCEDYLPMMMCVTAAHQAEALARQFSARVSAAFRADWLGGFNAIWLLRLVNLSV